MHSKIIQIPGKTFIAVLFGAAFWYFLENLQAAIVNYRFSCCDRCGNILFDREQPVLAVCAGLSLLIFALLKINGWKGIVKTLAITFLCFYPYWLFTYILAHPVRQECTALNYPRGNLPFFNEIAQMAVSIFWAGICAAVLLFYQGIKTIVVFLITKEEKI